MLQSGIKYLWFLYKFRQSDTLRKVNFGGGYLNFFISMGVACSDFYILKVRKMGYILYAFQNFINHNNLLYLKASLMLGDGLKRINTFTIVWKAILLHKTIIIIARLFNLRLPCMSYYLQECFFWNFWHTYRYQKDHTSPHLAEGKAVEITNKIFLILF